MKDLTSSKQRGSKVIKDKKGEILTEENDVLKRWIEYCSELYNFKTSGDENFSQAHESTDSDSYDILREEVVTAVKNLKKGKSAGVDNIPGELVQAGGEEMINILHKICNQIWKTGEWPKEWTQSLIITLPKKATYSCARTTGQLVLYAIPARSC